MTLNADEQFWNEIRCNFKRLIDAVEEAETADARSKMRRGLCGVVAAIEKRYPALGPSEKPIKRRYLTNQNSGLS